MSEEEQQLEGGAYEVIRARLDKQALDLRARLDTLNEERRSIFGAVETQLLNTERITTDHNCVPRDLVAIGNTRFLFGYNIQFGLKQTTDVSDVFAVYDYHHEDQSFHKVDVMEVLDVGGFREDFDYIYKYYRETTFIKFLVIGPHLYIALRIGKDITDIKTFKFLMRDDGTLVYEGNRFDHEYVFPSQQEFDWKRAHRDMHRGGEHPHISIEDIIFVETVGGDLTIKIEDNTASGLGIYREDVMDADQGLDDAEIFYAKVGPLILLKILPYREEDYRYLLYNQKTQNVHRLDAIGHSCVLLPDEHGIIFANGYKLFTGELKTFDHGLKHMMFERRVQSSNGEDTLYIFYNRLSGDYVLLSYNLIEQSVETPIICNGYSLFNDGQLVYFKTEDQAQKHHTLQVWQTPYISEDRLAERMVKQDSYLYKIGNPEIVTVMAECRGVLSLLNKEDNYAGLYLDLVKSTSNLLDGYFWIDREETGQLNLPLKEINGAAQAAIEEFDKVVALRKSTSEASEQLNERTRKLLREVETSPPDDILGFVHHLAELRRLRGEIIGLRDLRYADLDAITALEEEVVQTTEVTSQKTIEFLLKPEALDPYRKAVEDQSAELAKLKKVTEVDQLGENLDKSGGELEMLIDVVSNLKIEDATQTTAIIDHISTIYANLNGVRSALKKKRLELAKSEGVAQFGAQMKLLSQAVANYLDLSDTAAKCDEYLSKVMVQLEELEGKFAEFDDYVEEIAGKREQVYDAFETKKTLLLEARGKRATSLVKSAERILSSIKSRVSTYKEITEISGYFAGDLMIEKVRNIIQDLLDLDEPVKADDIQTRLKTLREDAVRALKDRQELFVDGKNVLQFGKHKFNVNTQDLELTIVPHEDEMCFHLSGTQYFEPVSHEEFLATRAVWNQEVISENKNVYRAEYLAYQALLHVEFSAKEEITIEDVQSFMQPLYAEAYTKGVHDLDAELLLNALLPMHRAVNRLRYSADVRAEAMLFWYSWDEKELKEKFTAKLKANGLKKKAFGGGEEDLGIWAQQLSEIYSDNDGAPLMAMELGKYLAMELSQEGGFVVSQEASALIRKFERLLDAKSAETYFQNALAALDGDSHAQYEVILDWLGSVDESDEQGFPYLKEAAAHLLNGGFEERDVEKIDLHAEVTGLKGSHSRLSENYPIHYNEFMERLRLFKEKDVKVFKKYLDLKQQVMEGRREEMRLNEFKPRVMSSFVRNKLLNEVYLPLIGDNLAKQLGTAGVDTRTDRMGMLLLISPPGYGKTTLMEYVANRLGITFMKINGPALGHSVTSLDPGEAPNASATEEVEKLNLALEMGDNVLIYLDDIQHTHPEFLQKFISLCDAQRKIEGVFQGKAKTYDLRGRKVAVVMAGNPYTESGGKFQIPDMLANRADTYNLGDILGGHEEAFKASYIENSLTSNSVLSNLSSKSQKDVYAIMKLAQFGADESVEFEGNYTPAEIDEMTKVMKHLYAVRDTILRVNLEYIRSAAQEDAYRTEPAFKLQGSYRNMNRIAEKILPLMTDEEVRDILIDHYENESQTLTTGAEANLLKFREMEGLLSEEEGSRWEQIKKDFRKQKLLGGAGNNDPVSRVVAQLTEFNEGLDSIRSGITEAAGSYAKPQTLGEETIAQLSQIIASLRAVPVKVDINLVPTSGDDESDPEITGLEKVSREKPPIEIEPYVSQGDPEDTSGNVEK